jgi:predicted ATPase
MIRQAARNRQVIISTQSVQLIDKFSPEDIIVVDRKDKESVFRRLNSNDLKGWLDEYSLGELWQKNLFGANP